LNHKRHQESHKKLSQRLPLCTFASSVVNGLAVQKEIYRGGIHEK
jgi:hypothetical protein